MLLRWNASYDAFASLSPNPDKLEKGLGSWGKG